MGGTEVSRGYFIMLHSVVSGVNCFPTHLKKQNCVLSIIKSHTNSYWVMGSPQQHVPSLGKKTPSNKRPPTCRVVTASVSSSYFSAMTPLILSTASPSSSSPSPSSSSSGNSSSSSSARRSWYSSVSGSASSSSSSSVGGGMGVA